MVNYYDYLIVQIKRIAGERNGINRAIKDNFQPIGSIG
jgi:hypothetical protein